ncbi:MAG: hypothetical protein AB8B53_00440 [Flavobacteriales bacterium]
MSQLQFEITKLDSENEKSEWAEFVGDRHPVLGLGNIEHRKGFGTKLWAVIFRKNAKVAGVALFEEVTFTFQENSLDVSSFVKNLISAIKFVAGMRNIRLLLCGDKILDGALGFKFNDLYSEVQKTEYLLKSGVAITKQKGVKQQYILLKSGEKRYFQRPWIFVPTEESFSLDITWETFDDYKSALKKKYRKRASSLLNKTAHLRIIEPTKDWWSDHLDKLTELYRIASEKYRFHFDHFDLNTVTNHLERENPCWRAYVYLDGEEIAGYFIAARKEESYFIHLAIQRYKENSAYSVYHRMLIDMVRIGIEHKMKNVKFGRTAPIAKSSLGAVPIETSIFLHSKKPWKRDFLNWLFERTDFEPTELRSPFD